MQLLLLSSHSRAFIVIQVMPTVQRNVLLAVVERNVVLIDCADPSSPQIRVIAWTAEADGLPADGWRFNDAKVSPGGTLIAGRYQRHAWAC